MTKTDLTYHYHEWSILYQTYIQSESFRNTLKVLSTDSINEETIITSFEGYHYPLYGLMYHPEFAYLEVKSRNPNIHLVQDEQIVEIAT